MLWRVLAQADRLIGLSAARAVASILVRAGARSPSGWAKGVYRVAARRAWSKAPDVYKLPERWWQTDPRVTVRRLRLDLDLDLRDNLQRILYYTGSYEPQVVGLIRRCLRRGDVFVDVGAHVGIHALTAARRLQTLGSGHVFAFEPARDSAERIRRAAKANGLDVTVVEVALGSASGTVELFGEEGYDEADAGVRSQYGKGPRVATVRVVTFDDWAREQRLRRLDVVKIDVEGAEPLVLRGMRESILRLRPRLLVVEVKHPSRRDEGVDPPGIHQELASLGYRSRGVALFGNHVFARLEGGTGSDARIEHELGHSTKARPAPGPRCLVDPPGSRATPGRRKREGRQDTSGCSSDSP